MTSKEIKQIIAEVVSDKKLMEMIVDGVISAMNKNGSLKKEDKTNTLFQENLMNIFTEINENLKQLSGSTESV